ncbi:MAG: MBL fold metallo-hydrolase [Lachnospiraceae bacterium]|nr:MBL fold metallo-hydrolase [Lachnospiraceae bacterium]
MSDFRIKTCVLGGVSTNCYVIYREGGTEAVLIDPADNGPYLLNLCRELGVEPVAVLLTHGHFDHILAADDIRRAFRCKIYVGMNEERMLGDPSLNLSGTLGTEQMGINADDLMRDGEVLKFLGRDWKVLFTPGHTEGSVCFYIASEQVLFSGDTLFADSLGRTDLPTGSSAKIVRSITETLFALPEDTMVYPGHGDPTTIGHEKQFNPVAVYCNRHS